MRGQAKKTWVKSGLYGPVLGRTADQKRVDGTRKCTVRSMYVCVGTVLIESGPNSRLSEARL
jgi:hypothetical protein